MIHRVNGYNIKHKSLFLTAVHAWTLVRAVRTATAYTGLYRRFHLHQHSAAAAGRPTVDEWDGVTQRELWHCDYSSHLAPVCMSIFCHQVTSVCTQTTNIGIHISHSARRLTESLLAKLDM